MTKEMEILKGKLEKKRENIHNAYLLTKRMNDEVKMVINIYILLTLDDVKDNLIPDSIAEANE